MTDTTDPRTGIISHSGGDAWGQTEAPPQAEQAPAPPEPGWPDVGQGANLNTGSEAFTAENLNSHSFWTQNREAILKAFKAGELPGQPNSTN